MQLCSKESILAKMFMYMTTISSALLDPFATGFVTFFLEGFFFWYISEDWIYSEREREKERELCELQCIKQSNHIDIVWVRAHSKWVVKLVYHVYYWHFLYYFLLQKCFWCVLSGAQIHRVIIIWWSFRKHFHVIHLNVNTYVSFLIQHKRIQKFAMSYH